MKYIQVMKSFAGFPLVLALVLLLQDVQVETVALGQGDLGLLVSDDENVALSGREGLPVGIADVGDVEAALVVLDVGQNAHSPDVVAAGDVHQLARLVLIPSDHLALLEVVLDGVSLVDFGVGEPDGAGIVGDDVGDLVGSNGLGLDLAELELGLGFLDGDEGEPALDVVKHTVVLVGLDHGEHVHDSDWELGISSDLGIDFESGLLVHGDEGDFAGVEGEVEAIPT